MFRRSVVLAAGLVVIAPTIARADDVPARDLPSPSVELAAVVVPDAPVAPLPEPAVAAVPAAPVAPLSTEAREAIRQACADEQPACDPVALLGSLERAALHKALTGRGLTVDRAPWGKTVGQIHVVTLPVFADGDGFLTVFNYLHTTTREFIVKREVVLRPGETWHQSAIDETARALRDPVTTTLAVVVPVESATPGQVDILAVTRDIWSLRLNSNYRFEDGTFTFLSLSLSENNFFGTHALASAVLSVDLGTIGFGPLLRKNNVGGKHVNVRLRGQALFSREAMLDHGRLDTEGSSSEVDVSRPLWKLDSAWGGGVSFSHRYSIVRQYQGLDLRTYDAPETAGDDAVPRRYRMKAMSLTTSAVHGFGSAAWKHRVTVGHALEFARPSVVDDFAGAPDVEAAFVRDVLPRSERNSVGYVTYNIFEPRYREYRNIGSFDLAEDLRLGATATASVGAGLEAIGSEADFVRASASAGYVLPVGVDGTASISGSLSGRRQDGAFIDAATALTLRAVSPTLGWLRVLGEFRVAGMHRETQNRYLTLGGDNGLRGFAINEFDGLRRLVAQFEVRTTPRRAAFTRWGLLAFYDVGGVADQFRHIGLHHDIGVGFRALIPQLASELMRVDVAMPLDADRIGTPRVIVGFDSEF